MLVKRMIGFVGAELLSLSAMKTIRLQITVACVFGLLACWAVAGAGQELQLLQVKADPMGNSRGPSFGCSLRRRKNISAPLRPL